MDAVQQSRLTLGRQKSMTLKLIVWCLFGFMLFNLFGCVLTIRANEYPRRLNLSREYDIGRAVMYSIVALVCAWALWG
jgi:hypothetical protein